MADCEFSEAFQEAFHQIRFGRKENAMLIAKINVRERSLIVDRELEDVNLEDVQKFMPQACPRFVIYSYKYEVGGDHSRVSLPLILIFYTPAACQIQLNMLYTSTKQKLIEHHDFSKVYNMTKEELTTEELEEKLKGFR